MSTSDVHELVTSRADGRDDGEDWTEDFQQLPGGAGISIILESSKSRRNLGPRPVGGDKADDHPDDNQRGSLL